MKSAVILLAGLFASVAASAECGVGLSYGRIKVGGISSAHGDEVLMSKYTEVKARVKDSSNVTELALQCEFSGGYAFSLSHLRGVRLSIDRDVHFTGYEGHGVSIPGGYLTTVHEDVHAYANRISGFKYFDYGIVAPYIQLGIQDVHATHRVWVNVKSYVLSYEESKSQVAPFVGLGVVIARKGPIQLRAGWQLLSKKPHEVSMYTIGVQGQF